MTDTPELIDLAKIPGEYISIASSGLAPGTNVGQRSSAVIVVPAPWTIGSVGITYEWFSPARRGSSSFWRVVSAESADGKAVSCV